MKNIVLKIIITIIIIIGILIIPQNKVEAKDYTVSDIAGMMTPNYVNTDKYSDLQKVIGRILGFLQVASGLTTVVVIAFLGFQILTETPEVKVQLKRKGLPIVIGVVLVFGATSVASFLLNVTVR